MSCGRWLCEHQARTSARTRVTRILDAWLFFCADQSGKPPELGAFAYFLQTVIHSQQRRETSPLISCFMKLLAQWTGSQWLLDPNGLHRALVSLTMNFRNRAAHIDELGKTDYAACRELVIGDDGALWRLLVATEGHRSDSNERSGR